MKMNSFRGMDDERKDFTICFQPASFSEILSVANLRHAASTVRSGRVFHNSELDVFILRRNLRVDANYVSKTMQQC